MNEETTTNSRYPEVKKSDAYVASVHPEINRGMPRYTSENIVRLGAAVRAHEALKKRISSHKDLHELWNLRDKIWELLRKEFL